MNLLPASRCPPSHRYLPALFASRAPDIVCDTLYIAGWLYGNTHALETLLDMFAAETGNARLVFNGNFNGFNVDNDTFRRVNETVLGFCATRGHVETELATNNRPDEACAQPEPGHAKTVAHTRHILEKLGATAQHHPDLLDQLQTLPMYRLAQIGNARAAIVHGDAVSLSGWGFSPESLQHQDSLHTAARWADEANVQIFASSYSDLPVLQSLPNAVIANNGAAGMPNFHGTPAGLITRISIDAYAGNARVYGCRTHGLHVDALALHYDTARWQQDFLRQWPPGSAAHESYWARIVQGPRYHLEQAMRFHPANRAEPARMHPQNAYADI